MKLSALFWWFYLDLRSRLANLQKMDLVKIKLERRGTALSSKWMMSSWVTSASIQHCLMETILQRRTQTRLLAQLHTSPRPEIHPNPVYFIGPRCYIRLWRVIRKNTPAWLELRIGCSEASQQVDPTSPNGRKTSNSFVSFPHTWWMSCSYRGEVRLFLDNWSKDDQAEKPLPLLHLILRVISRVLKINVETSYATIHRYRLRQL